MKIGVNAFCVKKELYEDFDGTLARLKEAGIGTLEVCISFSGNVEPLKGLENFMTEEMLAELGGGVWPYDQAGEKIKNVREAGIEVVSAHVMAFGRYGEPENFLELLPRIEAFANENAIKYYILGFGLNLAEMKKFENVIATVCDAMSKQNVDVLYHNMDTECVSQEGTTALDYILEKIPGLKLELDTGWAQFGGADALEYINKYYPRMPLLHLKDIIADACEENKNCCTRAIGEASMDLQAIMDASRKCPLDECGIIIDQDSSPTDIIEDLATGVKNIISTRCN